MSRSPRPARARCVARQHGFATWSELADHVARLSPDDEPFARAQRSLEAPRRRRRCARSSTARPSSSRRARDQRQRPARDGDRDLRRAHGRRSCSSAARTPRRANAHGWTALHQAAYVGLPPLARMLLDAGAPLAVSARGDGGTPLDRRAVLGAPRDGRAARRARRSRRATCAPPRAWATARPDRRAARPGRHACARRRRRSAASTGRTAASRPGDPSDDPAGGRRRGAQPGRRATTAPTALERARRARRDARRRRLPRHGAGLGGAPAAASAAIRRLLALGADPNAPHDVRRPATTARARRRSTSPPQGGSRRRRSGRCSRPAPTPASATPATTIRRPVGRSSAAGARLSTSCASMAADPRPESTARGDGLASARPGPAGGGARRPAARGCGARLADHRRADGRHGRGPRDRPRIARVLRLRMDSDDGGDDAPVGRPHGRGALGGRAAQARARPRREPGRIAGLRRRVSARLDGVRPRGLRAVRARPLPRRRRPRRGPARAATSRPR